MIDFYLRDCGVKPQELISDSYPHSHKAVSAWGEGHKIYFFLNLMLNLKNNEHDAAVFDEICKKNAKIKIKFQKNEG